MAAARLEGSGRLRMEALRWGLSLVAVLAVHVGGAATLLAWRIPHDMPAAPPAVLMELAPVASAPTPEVSDVAPGPQQEIAEPPPQPDTPVKPPVETEALTPPPPEREQVKPEIPDRLAELVPPPETPPEVALELPPPKPPETKPPPPETKPPPKVEKPPTPRKPQPDRKPRATQTTAPSAAPVPQAQAAAAPPPGIASQPSPDAVKRWQATLVAHLQRHKRYPAAARSNNEEGTAYLRFAMDRTGHVLLKSIARASGHRALDQETLELLERAQPLPAPPTDMPGERFEFVVPVQFQLR
jgi:periplasmic protein TonB